MKDIQKIIRFDYLTAKPLGLPSFLVVAVMCFGLSLFFNHIALSVMDASNEFIHNAFTRAMIFRNCGIGLAAAGIVCLLIRFLKF